MATKRVKRSTRSVKSLRAKHVTGKQAKSVKGGIIVVCRTSPLQDKTSPLLVKTSPL
jgi:hypothetical protein